MTMMSLAVDTRATMTPPDVLLISPVTEEWYSLMWDWIQHAAEATCDDFGPQTLEDYRAERRAMQSVERLWGVVVAEQPCGFIQFTPQTPMLGTMHVCFDPSVQGMGIATTALHHVRGELVAAGITKITIACFTDNHRVIALCRRFGAVNEGLLRNHTRARGKLRDMALMAIFKETP